MDVCMPWSSTYEGAQLVKPTGLNYRSRTTEGGKRGPRGATQHNRTQTYKSHNAYEQQQNNTGARMMYNKVLLAQKSCGAETGINKTDDDICIC
jgi:hypothetical protein